MMTATKKRPNRPRPDRALALRAFGGSRRAEMSYVTDLRAIMRGFAAAMARHIERLAKRRADSWWDEDFDRVTLDLALQVGGHVGKAFDRMAEIAQDHGAEAAAELLGIRYTEIGIDQEIKRAREESIALVEKAGRSYAADVRAVFGDPANSGKPWEEMKGLLLERGSVSESRAELIARDQSLKLNGAIARTRQQNAGVTKYEWSTSLDERVRPDHRDLQGSVQSWDNPPVVDKRTGRREHPGGDFQCRCVPIPVIEELADLGLSNQGNGRGPTPEAPPPPPPKEPRARAPRVPPAQRAAELAERGGVKKVDLRAAAAAIQIPDELGPNEVYHVADAEIVRGVAKGWLRDALGLAPRPRPDSARLSAATRPGGMDGAEAVHHWNGRVEAKPGMLRDVKAAFEAAGRGQRVTDERLILQTKNLIHEELHGVSPLAPHQYLGSGMVIEEVTTEVLARDAVGKVLGVRGFSELGAYEPFFDQVYNAVARGLEDAGQYGVDFAREELVRASKAFKQRVSTGSPAHDFAHDVAAAVDVPASERANVARAVAKRLETTGDS